MTRLGKPHRPSVVPIRVAVATLLCPAVLNAEDRKPALVRPAAPPPAAPGVAPGPANRGTAPITPGRGAAPATLNLALGQSPDEVIALLGQPKNIVNLGGKKIYVFQDVKVTFTDGKVTDIQ